MKVAPKDGRRREITPPVKMKVVPKIGIQYHVALRYRPMYIGQPGFKANILF